MVILKTLARLEIILGFVIAVIPLIDYTDMLYATLYAQYGLYAGVILWVEFVLGIIILSLGVQTLRFSMSVKKEK